MASVAPEFPAVGLFAVGLVAALVALFLVLLRFGAVTLIGGLLRWLANLVSWVPFVGHLTEEGVNAGINAVDEALGAAVAASTGLATSMIHDAWKITVWVGDTIADLATSTAHAVTTIVTSTIPNAVHAITHPITLSVAAIEARIGRVERHALADIRRGINAVKAATAGALVLVTNRIRAAEHSIATTIPAELAHVEGRLYGWTSKQLRRLSRRMSAVEEAVGLTALTGVIVGVVARELPWIRCKNVGKVGRHLCSWPIKGLEDLLAGAIDVLILLDICKLVAIMEAVAFDMEPFIIEFNDAVNKLACFRNYSAPGRLDLAVHEVPPVSLALPL